MTDVVNLNFNILTNKKMTIDFIVTSRFGKLYENNSKSKNNSKMYKVLTILFYTLVFTFCKFLIQSPKFVSSEDSFLNF